MPCCLPGVHMLPNKVLVLVLYFPVTKWTHCQLLTAYYMSPVDKK